MTDQDTAIATLKSLVADFCTVRDWDRYHSAKELAVGIVTEEAELLDEFRFKSDAEVDAILADADGRRRVEHEIADVLFFVLRLAQRYGVDLATALEAKMALNAERYPVDRARGSNRKYNEI